jgi:pimeloyl-ACP methyl ester carboxylesterase
MARVVMCHGIGYQFKHHETVLSDWYQCLRSGMTAQALEPPGHDQVALVGYGSCFRSIGAKSGSSEDEIKALPPMGLSDVRDQIEFDLIESFTEGLEDDKDGVTKGLGQSTLRRLERSDRLGRPPAKLILWLARQVRRYLDPDDDVRDQVQDLFARFITADTKVIIGHSLGSIIAYEAVSNNPEWNIDTFITLGSPLGLRVVRERLVPAPAADGTLHCPEVAQWHNIAADEDPIALVKELEPFLAPSSRNKITDHKVVNSGLSRVLLGGHSVLRYLTTQELAKAVGASLQVQRR